MRSSRRHFVGVCFGLLAGLALAAFPAVQTRAEDGAVVAAAASLRYALDEIVAQYEKKTGQKPRITYGATGNLVQQIEKAAPFQMLFAADDQSVKKLAAENLTEGAPSIFARGQISIVAPKGSPVAVDGELQGLRDALVAGKVAHFAIANPDVAPYGRAAREALQKAGLWDKLAGKIVLGENVGQAAQFAMTGAAEAGIVAQSLAVSAEMAPKITSAAIPESWHEPIDHGMALIKGAGEPARAFAAYVRGSEGRAVLERSGFSVPGP
jgi:molybdate transport system substrate-binding protein